MLTNDHIDYIIKDLSYRGIVLEGFQDEMTDHICSLVEIEMKNGKRFIDAYHYALKTFGNTSGLRKTQHQTFQSANQKSTIMLKNYFTIAWRNMHRQGFYSSINIIGLAVGIAACLIIILFVVNELSYDRYNSNADRIYRVHQEIKFGSNHSQTAVCPAPFAPTLQQEYPEIEATTRFLNWGTFLVKSTPENENSKEEHVAWTDSTFFKLFSINVLEGNPESALSEPASIAISKRTAEKYFPGKSALGQSLILDNNYNGHITAVYDDIPDASHFHFDILIALVGDWPAAKEAQQTYFGNNNFYTYLLLKKNTDARALETKFPGFLKKYMGRHDEKETSGSSSDKHVMTLMPLTDIHLHSQQDSELEPNGSITYVYLFSIIAFFILIIACINFMNLATARFGTRAKEVGVRKVMGSLRFHLIRQFLMESVLITLFAFVVAIVLCYTFLPLFNHLLLKQLHLPLNDPLFYLILLLSSMAVGLLAGAYPSFFLSAFKPVNVLKGRAALGTRGRFLRSGLVIFQFVISIFLIVGTITINKQLAYIQNKRLGFEKEHVLVIKDAYALRPNIQAFKNEVEKINSIYTCTISGFIPVTGSSDVSRRDRTFWKQGSAAPGTDHLISLQQWSVDEDYINTFKMKIVLGRGFSKEFHSDTEGVVLNEAAALQFGLGDDPVGKKIETFTGTGQPDFKHPKEYTVLGIVENFHFSSMEENILPLGLFLGRSDGFVCVRFDNSNPQEVIESLEKAWKKNGPGQPFQYSFLDEDYGRMYAAEQRLGKMFIVFASLAIIIACLGLFALTTFMAEQRAKEIGIRKVLGASVDSILLLLSKDFGKLILIAFILATPLAWYSMSQWLKSYAYKTEIGAFVFISAGALAFCIALITMGYQAIKAAMANPVKSLNQD